MGFPGDRRTPPEKETCRPPKEETERGEGIQRRGEGNVCLREKVAAMGSLCRKGGRVGKVRKVSGVKMEKRRRARVRNGTPVGKKCVTEKKKSRKKEFKYNHVSIR